MDRFEPIRSGMRSDRHLPHLVVESACSNHSPCPSHRSVCPVELVRKGCAQRTRSAFVVLFEVVERSRVVGSCRAGSGPRSRRRAASLYHHHHHHHHCFQKRKGAISNHQRDLGRGHRWQRKAQRARHQFLPLLGINRSATKSTRRTGWNQAPFVEPGPGDLLQWDQRLKNDKRFGSCERKDLDAFFLSQSKTSVRSEL